VRKLGAELGFLDLTERNFQGMTYAQLLREMVGSQVCYHFRFDSFFRHACN